MLGAIPEPAQPAGKPGGRSIATYIKPLNQEFKT